MWRTIIRVLVGLAFLWSAGTPLHAQLETIDRFESITIGEDPPETCKAHKALHIQTPDNVVNVCRSDGQGWDAPPAPVPLGTGIRMASSGKEVRTMRWQTQELSGDTTLGNNSLILYLVGDGATTQLPDPSDPDTPGYYRIIIKDAGTGSLTLIPFDTELINGVNAAPAPITGRRSEYEIWLVDGNWEVKEWSIQGYGDPMTSICSAYNGDTNNSSSGSGTAFSHSLTCTIPGGALRAGSHFEWCTGWHVVTGGTALTMIWEAFANNTSIAAAGSALTMSTNIAGRNITHCLHSVVTENPSAASNIYTAPQTYWTGLTTGTEGSVVAQPVAVNTNNDIVLTRTTKWNAAGTGTNTIKQLSSTVRMKR